MLKMKVLNVEIHYGMVVKVFEIFSINYFLNIFKQYSIDKFEKVKINKEE